MLVIYRVFKYITIILGVTVILLRNANMNFNQFRDIINKYFQLSMVSKLLKLDLSGKRLFSNTKLNLNTIKKLEI